MNEKNYITPFSSDISSILSTLYGSDLSVTESQQVLGYDDGFLCAVYIDSSDNPVALGICDLKFSAYAGGALSMLPKLGVEDSISEGEISSTIGDNVHEILNICSRLFVTDQTPHLKLGTVYSLPTDLPDNVETLLKSSRNQVNFTAKIPNYGEGQISFWIN